jgi:tRNA(fMet)-specific endonuclease VapC
MPVRYLLDTDAFSDIVREVPSLETGLSLVGQTSVAISTVTLKEIEFGRRRRPERMTLRRSAIIDTYLREIKTFSFDAQDAYSTAQIRATLARAGTPIGPYDVMIAGTALARGLIVVTANTREFSRVTGLQLEDWRQPISEVREMPAEYRVTRIPRTRASVAA